MISIRPQILNNNFARLAAASENLQQGRIQVGNSLTLKAGKEEPIVNNGNWTHSLKNAQEGFAITLLRENDVSASGLSSFLVQEVSPGLKFRDDGKTHDIHQDLKLCTDHSIVIPQKDGSNLLLVLGNNGRVFLRQDTPAEE